MHLKETLQVFIAFSEKCAFLRKPPEQTLSTGASNHKAAGVSCDGTQNCDDVQSSQFQNVTPGEESGGKQDCLFRHRYAQVAYEDAKENAQIAPAGQPIGHSRGTQHIMHIRLAALAKSH